MRILLIILSILAITSTGFAQNGLVRKPWFDDANFWITEAVTGTNTLASTTATIYGSKTRTETVKDSGSTRADGYLRWWLDSTDVIVNGDFSADSTGWDSVYSSWTISGGVASYDDVVNSSALVHETMYLYKNINYKLAFDVSNTTGLNLYFLATSSTNLDITIASETAYANGSYTINFTTQGFNTDGFAIIAFTNGSTGDIDNIVLTAIADSSQGLTKVFQLSNLIEDTTYNYRASTVPTNGSDTYSQGADSTFTTPLTAPNIIDVTASDPYELTIGIGVNTRRTTGWNLIERRWTNDDSAWVQIDSIGITETFYADSGLALGDSMSYRTRCRVTNYSAYSNVISGVVTLPTNDLIYNPGNLTWGIIDSTAGGSTMPSIVYIDSAFSSIVTDTLVFTHWGSIEAGQLILLLHGTERNQPNVFGGANTPAGYTFLGEAGDNTTASIGVYYKIATGSESGTVTSKCSGSSENVGWYIVIDNVNTSNPINIVGDTSFIATDILSLKTLTTDADNSLVLGFYGIDGANWTSLDITGTGWSLYDTAIPRISGSASGVALVTKELSSAGASGVVTIDVDIDNNGICGFQFAIEGNAGGGSADSALTFTATNTGNFETVTVDTVTGQNLPFTVAVDSTYPFVVPVDGVVTYTVTLNRDTSGEFIQSLTFDTDFTDGTVPLYANVLPGEPGISPPDTTAPEAPTSLVATGYNSGGSTWINVSWVESTSPDKDSLRLFAAPIGVAEGVYSLLTVLAEGTTEYNDTSLEAEETRWYKIYQQDDSSNISVASNADSGLVPADEVIPPPNAPYDLEGTSNTLAINLIFKHISTNEDSFFIYIDGVKDTALAASDTAYTQYGLANNTSYEFKVSAWNSTGGESNFSNIINVSTLNDVVIGEGDICDIWSAAITVAFNVEVTGYADSLVATWDHADPDSVFVTYILPAALNACCGNDVGHPCDGADIDSVNQQGATRWTWFSPPAGVWDIKLRVKDILGNVSTWSVADSGLVPIAIEPDTTAPDAPVLVSVDGYNTGDSTYNLLAYTVDNVADGDSVTIWSTTIDDTLSAYTEIATIDKTFTEWSDGIIDVGEVAKYKLTQQDDSLNVSAFSNAISGLVPSSPTFPPPNAPSISGVGDTLAIHLTIDTTGCGVLDSIFIYKDGVKTYPIITLTKTDTPVSNNTSHSYYATVFHNTNGESNASNVINVSSVDTTGFLYTKWYVDNQAFGGNNGTSWANAWTSFAAISWGSISPGDIVYISGGTDSTIYYEELGLRGVNGAADNPITIRNSWDAGHNGRVIIDGGGAGSNACVIGNYNFSSFITLYGLEFQNADRLIYIHAAAEDITIDSCKGTNWYLFGFRTQGSSGKQIKNIIIQNSDLISAKEFGQDALQFNESENHILRNNFIRMRRWVDYNVHADGMLAMLSYNFVVYNNIVVLDSNMQGQNYILRASSEPGLTDSVIVYNNYFYYDGVYNSSDPPYCTGLFLRYQSSDGARPPTYVVNNTFMCKGRYLQGVHTETAATFVNNIVVQYAGGSSGSYYALFRGNQAIDSIRQNLLWQESGVTGTFFQGSFSPAGTNPTWSEWVANGGTGINSDPLFEMEIDTVYGEGQANVIGDLKSNSPAINAGEDVQNIIEGYTLWDGTQLHWVDIGERVEGRLGITTGNARATETDSVTIGAYNPPWRR